MINRVSPPSLPNLRAIAFTVAFVATLGLPRLAAQAPGTISFQGYLTDAGDVPANATVQMTFTMYKGATDVWTEVNPSVTVTNGIFDVVLGHIIPLDTLTFDRPMELGVSVGNDAQMVPRVELTSAPYARALPGLYTKLIVSGADSLFNVVGGARFNEIEPGSVGATISGGGGSFSGAVRPNKIMAGSDYGTIGGGDNNMLTGDHATISGGYFNVTGGPWSTVGGGYTNHATGDGATVGGGDSNHATGSRSTIAGGSGNYATATSASVFGGGNNYAIANFSSVGGGQWNAARGEYSFAAGYNARPQHNGSFVWGDRSVTEFADSIFTTGPNQFLIRAAGGVGIGTNDPGSHSLAIVDNGAGGIPGSTLEVDNNSTGAAIAAHFETSGTDATVVIDQDGTGDHIRTFDNGDLRFRVTDAGNVTADGTITGGGADMAESVEVEGRLEEFEAGDVLVVSQSENRSFALSSEPYSDLVAGVFATKPGVLMTNRGVEEDLSDRVPLGVVGIIPTKVTAENGPIRRGDLLVTSSTPGHAMRGDRSRLEFGMVLGKALEPFEGPGNGEIEVLVMPR